MPLIHALLDVLRIVFWSIVIHGPGGGPKHDSYGYALFARHCAKNRLQQFLTAGIEGEEHRRGGVR